MGGGLRAQIESYGNMVEPVLDSLRYQTAYAFDVLTYLIVDRLASSGRDKLKPDGLNISDWLQVHGLAMLAAWCARSGLMEHALMEATLE